jgi:hypothetical protein
VFGLREAQSVGWYEPASETRLIFEKSIRSDAVVEGSEGVVGAVVAKGAGFVEDFVGPDALDLDVISGGRRCIAPRRSFCSLWNPVAGPES